MPFQTCREAAIHGRRDLLKDAFQSTIEVMQVSARPNRQAGPDLGDSCGPRRRRVRHGDDQLNILQLFTNTVRQDQI